MLTYHKWCFMAFTWEQFQWVHKQLFWVMSLKIMFLNYRDISRPITFLFDLHFPNFTGTIILDWNFKVTFGTK